MEFASRGGALPADRIEFMIAITVLTVALVTWSVNVIRYMKVISGIARDVTQAYDMKVSKDGVEMGV